MNASIVIPAKVGIQASARLDLAFRPGRGAAVKASSLAQPWVLAFAGTTSL